MPDFGDGAALVVGGSGGVGSAVAHGLAAAGVPLAITYRRNEDGARELASEVEAAGGSCSVHQLDLGDLDAARACVQRVVDEHGTLHTVAHCAGAHIDQPYVSQVTPEQWREAIDGDVHGAFNLIHATLPHLRASKGSMTFISSAGLERFPPGDVLSVAPKAAIEALLRAVAREEGRYGVRANCVAVGVVDAGMFPKLVERGELTQAWVDAALQNTPLRRFATPSEVADSVVFLASARARYITGQTLFVDGGYTL